METRSGESVKVEKEFSVPVEALFDAWTAPEQLKQWWKPMGHQLVDVTNDLREGGRVEYRFETGTENSLTVNGEYLEVKPAEKLVYTWNWQVNQPGLHHSEYKLTLNFSSSQHGSKIEVSQENFKDQESVLPHQEGWERSLEDLAKFLDGKPAENKGGASSTAADHEGKPDYGSQNPAEG